MKQTTPGSVLSGSFKNNYSVQTLTEWLGQLGQFTVLTPGQAAARWGVSPRQALRRLHAMVGGPLEIPAGCVEMYVRATWVSPTPAPCRPSESWATVREQRYAMIPDTGATMSTLAQMWGVTKQTAKRLALKMRQLGLIDYRREGKVYIWMRREAAKGEG